MELSPSLSQINQFLHYLSGFFKNSPLPHLALPLLLFFPDYSPRSTTHYSSHTASLLTEWDAPDSSIRLRTGVKLIIIIILKYN
jgi:hypothetical protein